MARYLLTLLLALLSACSTLPEDFENRVACSEAGDEAYTVSKWKWFGFAFDLSKKDLPYLCPPDAPAAKQGATR